MSAARVVGITKEGLYFDDGAVLFAPPRPGRSFVVVDASSEAAVVAYGSAGRLAFLTDAEWAMVEASRAVSP